MSTLFAPGRKCGFYLRRPTMVRQPSRLAAVAFEACYTPLPESKRDDGKDVPYFGSLLEWGGVHYRMENDDKVCRNEDRGCTRDSFWNWLYGRMKGGGTHWIFAWKMYPFLCLVDFVQELTEGRLIITSSEFDQNVPGPVKKRKRLSGLMVLEDPPTIVIAHKPGGGTVKFIDLANYGIPCMAQEASPLQVKVAYTWAAVSSYRDLIRKADLGSWQHTAAAQGYYAYRRSHMLFPVKVHPFDVPLKLERAAYYGGRCEAARIGKLPGKIFHLDFNSQYTSIAHTEYFPTEFVAYNKDVSIADAKTLMSTSASVADVTIECKHPWFPLRDGGRIIYPVGTFRTYLCGPELKVAIETDCVRTIHQMSLYSQVSMFATWACHAIACKAVLMHNGMAHMVPAFKRICNALYGKFGQLPRRWITLPERSAESLFDQWWEPHPKSGLPTPTRSYMGVVQYQDQEGEGRLSCPAISAYMTSYARVLLTGAILDAGRENVYYWDTDSLMVNEEGMTRLGVIGMISDVECGKLKVVEVSDDVEIFGVKNYRFGPRWVCSGASGVKLALPNRDTAWHEHVGFSAGLWHGRAGESKVIVRRRPRKGHYKQGRVLADGTVVPFVYHAVNPTLEVANAETEMGDPGSPEGH